MHTGAEHTIRGDLYAQNIYVLSGWHHIRDVDMVHKDGDAVAEVLLGFVRSTPKLTKERWSCVPFTKSDSYYC